MASNHQEPNYMMVFFALFVLTVVEVGVVFVPVSKLLIAIVLVLLALTKAALVALYFMHLRYEKVALGVIALTPLLLCTLLIISLLPDLTRAPHASPKPDQAPKAAVEQASTGQPAEADVRVDAQ